MKYLLIFSLFPIAAAASKSQSNSHVTIIDFLQDKKPDGSVHLNDLIHMLFARIRHTINHGSNLLGIPRLDPLELDEFHLQIPPGLINLDLQLKNSVVSGIGGFVVHKSELVLPDLTFDIDVSVPRVDISTELFILSGDFLTALPLYRRKAKFMVEGFRYQAKLYLKQSDDGKSIIIDKIEGASFEIPLLESKIEGAIGGGDIDHIANAVVEDVIIEYVNKFSGALSQMGSTAFINVTNPILEKLDSWWFVEPFL